jgi:DnaJ family protein A protein 2
MVKDTVLYDRLGVPPTASEDEILRAFKRMAVKTHPDKNPDDPDANKKFQEVNQAKDILADPDKRNVYDQIGMEFINNEASGGHPDGVNPADIFNMFNGGSGHHFSTSFSHFGGGRQEQKENITINQEVTLEQIYNQESIHILFKQKHICLKCDGNGTKDGTPSKCSTCNGNGIVIQRIQMGPMIQQIQTVCPQCRGSCKFVCDDNKCNYCNGECYNLKDVKTQIPLKNGLSNGQQILLKGHGHHLKEGKTDLIIVINEKEHSNFKRNGNDLIISVELKLYQALFGFDKIIEHLDKRKLYISHNGKTEYNTLRKISNEGMNILNTNTKGDLIIKFNINLPICASEISNKLLYLLKTIDQDETNNEVLIKNNKTQYIKTLLCDISNYNTNKSEEQNNQQHQHQQQCAQS